MVKIIRITPPGIKGSTLHSLQDALKKAQQLDKAGKAGESLRILCTGGTYPVRETIRISGKFSVPLSIESAPGEKAVFDGSFRVTNWKKTKLNHKNVLYADIPQELAPDGFIRAFYVNGSLAKCASFPKDEKGGYEVEKGGVIDEKDPGSGYDHFYPKKEDFSPDWYNLPGMEVLFIQKWTESYLPFRKYTKDGALHFRYSTSLHNYGWAKTLYFFRNVREALTEEGEYYFDNTLSRIYYLPRKGEKADTLQAVLPMADMMLLLKDTSSITVKNLTFRYGGRTFPKIGPFYDLRKEKIRNHFVYAHTLDAGKKHPSAQAVQGASQLPGTISIVRAEDCQICSCTVERSSWYGVLIGEGCRDIKIDSCALQELGGGGIIACGANADKDPLRHEHLTQCLTIRNNHIHDCGRIYLSSTGIMLGFVRGTLVEHNEIHDLYYSGISCGWTWGYSENSCRENRILFNKIHDLGKNMLCDMGGIYMLGIQPGSRVGHNLIYNISCRYYGGWALYTDEGSSHMILENNVTHDCACEGYHHHYGRENILRGNLFIAHKHNGICLSVGRENTIGYKYPGENYTNNCNFFRNVIVTDGNPALYLTRREFAGLDQLYCDSNIYWDLSGRKQKNFADLDRYTGTPLSLTFAQWQKETLQDRNSVFADPGFVDLEKRDLHLKKDSILHKYAFPDPGITLDLAGLCKESEEESAK